MECDKEKVPRIVQAASEQAGAFLGTSVAIGKKIAGLGAKSAAAMSGLLGLSAKQSAPAASTPETIAETVRKNALRRLVTAMEADLAAARQKAEKTQSELASQLQALEKEKQTLISDLEKAKHKADTIKAQEEMIEKESTIEKHTVQEQIKSAVLPPEPDKVKRKVKEPEQRPRVTETKKPAPIPVTPEKVESAVFPDAAKKIIFKQAISDMANRDAAVRVDAAKTLAGIRHELSVRVLAAQMANEPSSQVRQECVKALTKLEMQEGLPAIKLALTDEVAAVRLAAVWGLYHLTGAESFESLTRMFLDKDEEVRRRAATCIGWLGQNEFAVTLLPLVADKSVSVRQAAIEAMGNLHSRQVVSALIECLNDPEESIRKAALRAIEKITGKKMGRPSLIDEKSYQRLMARWREWWKQELLE